jgi:hypothetical protein
VCLLFKLKYGSNVGCPAVFGQKAEHDPISVLKKLKTAKFKAFPRKKV